MIPPTRRRVASVREIPRIRPDFVSVPIPPVIAVDEDFGAASV
jgi:hypothetical protein